MDKRRVSILAFVRGNGMSLTKVPIAEGTFVQYGTNYEEFDSGVIQFTSAIVEMDDGTVRNVPCEDIVFLNPEGAKNGKK